MALTVTYTNARITTGTLVDIRGIGQVGVGQGAVLTATQETNFTKFHGVKAEVKAAGDGAFVVTGTPLT